jgi:hypothetical protein
MNLNGKKIWELTGEEIEHAYKNLHMNNYVYAALNCYYRSAYPKNKIVRLRKENVPGPLIRYAEDLVGLSPYLGNDDSKTVRINYTYYAFRLFSALADIGRDDLESALELLAALAYIPIVAEKNDDFELWKHPVMRPIDTRAENILAGLKPDTDVFSFLSVCMYENEKSDIDGITPIKAVFLFVIRCVQALIIHCENDTDRKLIDNAFRSIEGCMLTYESANGLSGQCFKGKLQNPGQIRYRNTLYLYFGDFVRRTGDGERAFEVYTKDINTKELPDLFGFYLTDMKTVERLLCACEVLSASGKPAGELKGFIADCMMTVFDHAARYARDVLDAVARNPGIDLSSSRIRNGEKSMLYAGEASREPFLLALLYSKMVNGTDFKDIDYGKYLIF